VPVWGKAVVNRDRRAYRRERLQKTEQGKKGESPEKGGRTKRERTTGRSSDAVKRGMKGEQSSTGGGQMNSVGEGLGEITKEETQIPFEG